MIVATGLLGRLFHELINYVQHYGLVRIENFPLKEHHSWDCYRTISNSLHYNLPRHSDHHMAATKAFWRLHAHQQAPMLPYGYQTMAFIALTLLLWGERIMRPLLADRTRITQVTPRESSSASGAGTASPRDFGIPIVPDLMAP